MKTLIVIALLSLSTAASADIAATGKVVSLTGEAKNVTTSKTLAVDSPVSPGDHISTSANASVRILLGNDVAVQVGPSSDFYVERDNGHPWSLKLLSGMVLSAVRKAVKSVPQSGVKFELKTGEAVMGVRGTVFFVKMTPSKPTFLCVCMGTVDVKAAGGKIQKTIFARHHDSPQFIDETSGTPKTIAGEVGNDHSDADMNSLKALVK